MNTPKIESYRFGSIRVDGQTHSKDVIILPERVVAGWWRQEGHTLWPDDLKAVFEAAPEVLVVGSGSVGRMEVPAYTRQQIEAAGIELIVERTAEACQTYNRLRQTRRVAAALHLTC
ncbi:MAG: MTH938/NDUFAF3 family protein [Anaerolineae bacterium]|nr:MTH938/NDUFAF3 family protein [Anaerolineae bacterium]